jgi:hypothetical protein
MKFMPMSISEGMDSMDRSSPFGKSFIFIAVWMLLWMAAGPFKESIADVVLLDPPAPAGPPRLGENFTESRFGSPPIAPNPFQAGIESMQEEEDEIEVKSGLSRGLASEKPAQTPVQAQAQAQAQTTAVPASALVRNGVQEIALIAGDLGFFPKTVFVTRDIPVRMFVTGASKKPLCIMMDSFQVRKQVRAQKIEEINFVPTTPGKYRFYCPVNGMEGTLLVKELSSNSATSAFAKE